MVDFMSRGVGLVAVAALGFLTSGCGGSGEEHLTLTAQVLGRKYTAEIDGKGHLYPSGLVTTLRFGNNHQLAIEKERLMLDGKECAKIWAESRDFDITFAKQTLTVKVDRRVVYTAQISDTPPEKAAAQSAPNKPS